MTPKGSIRLCCVLCLAISSAFGAIESDEWGNYEDYEYDIEYEIEGDDIPGEVDKIPSERNPYEHYLPALQLLFGSDQVIENEIFNELISATDYWKLDSILEKIKQKMFDPIVQYLGPEDVSALTELKSEIQNLEDRYFEYNQEFNELLMKHRDTFSCILGRDAVNTVYSEFTKCQKYGWKCKDCLYPLWLETTEAINTTTDCSMIDALSAMIEIDLFEKLHTYDKESIADEVDIRLQFLDIFSEPEERALLEDVLCTESHSYRNCSEVSEVVCYEPSYLEAVELLCSLHTAMQDIKNETVFNEMMIIHSNINEIAREKEEKEDWKPRYFCQSFNKDFQSRTEAPPTDLVPNNKIEDSKLETTVPTLNSTATVVNTTVSVAQIAIKSSNSGSNLPKTSISAILFFLTGKLMSTILL